MSNSLNPKLGRRDIIRVFASGAAAVTAASSLPQTTAHADSENDAEKRKARYQANSAEVQTFYRVNRYPNT